MKNFKNFQWNYNTVVNCMNFGVTQTWVQIPVLPVINCEILSELTKSLFKMVIVAPNLVVGLSDSLLSADDYMRLGMVPVP